MSAHDAERWDRRHARADPPSPAPPDALVAAGLGDAASLANVVTHAHVAGPSDRRRALDVACGAGAVAAWLAQRGWSVVALDVSEVALARVRAAADQLGVASSIDTRRVDLDAGLPASLGSFELVVCQRFRDPDLHPALLERTAVGGICAITVLSESGADDPGPFHAPAGELRTALAGAGVEVLHHSQGGGSESIVVRRRGGTVT
ncbi:methyltransferase domain-containing protein [Ilumatobacter sp.]|uniref:methyltransferase domain-containing protein n=1 Tax=Ilumatobacter sp. TaxID=1967498 RepID=UPI003B518229